MGSPRVLPDLEILSAFLIKQMIRKLRYQTEIPDSPHYIKKLLNEYLEVQQVNIKAWFLIIDSFKAFQSFNVMAFR